MMTDHIPNLKAAEIETLHALREIEAVGDKKALLVFKQKLADMSLEAQRAWLRMKGVREIKVIKGAK